MEIFWCFDVYIISTLSLIFIIKLYHLPIASVLSSINNRESRSPPCQSVGWVWQRCGALSEEEHRTTRAFIMRESVLVRPTLSAVFLIPHCSWQLIHCRSVHPEHTFERYRAPKSPQSPQLLDLLEDFLNRSHLPGTEIVKKFYYLQWNSIKKAI